MPEKIDLNLENQKVNFVPKVKQKFNMKEVNIPEFVNSNFARILGYYLGEGVTKQIDLTFLSRGKKFLGIT